MIKLTFGSLAATAVFMAVVSLFPSHSNLYSSAWAVTLWSFTALCAVVAIMRVKLWKRKAVFLLHAALLLILTGALVTHITGKTDQIHLRVGDQQTVFGYKIRLDKFEVQYYPATSAPSDFIAEISVNDGKAETVSINHVADIDNFRILLSSCDSDRAGCLFTISQDRAGTIVSYAGYLLLLIAMIAVSIKPKRSLATVAMIVFLFGSATAAPRTVPRVVSDVLGDLFVYHNDRVAPFSTLARDFTVKIYGSDKYDGLSPEQVMAGWLFFYDDWKNDPGIKIKDKKARLLMGIEGNRAKLTDFFNKDGYLFDKPEFIEANEKFALVSSAATGSVWKMFPYGTDSINPSASVQWFSPVDQLPDYIDMDSWRMTRHSFGYLAELIAQGDWQESVNVINKIAKYQEQKCAGLLPSPGKIQAERLFMKLSGSLWPIILLTVSGIILCVYPRTIICRILLLLGLLWIAFLTGLNAYASGHMPMSNGYETMQWMAVSALGLCFFIGRKNPEIMPFGLIVAGMALAVSLMGQRNPQLTNIMPVLQSPLLCVHVLAMMLAYSLLAIMALISIMSLAGKHKLLYLARILLRPAVFLLAFGIFTGAVWANISWGRYWGWDPKEVWALITLIVYSFPLHASSLPVFKNDRKYAVWIIASFSIVLMTYFGVNYILGGLHAYA